MIFESLTIGSRFESERNDSVYLRKYTSVPENCNITFVKCVLPLDPLLLRIATTAYLENYEYLWDDGGISYLNTFYNKETFLRELENPSISFYLIYVEEVPAGFFKIKRNVNRQTPEKSLDIDKLYLLKEFTGRQLGKQVLHYIEKQAGLQGHKQVSLQVMDSSPAKSFYLRNGYVQTDETRLAYPFMKPGLNLIVTLEKAIA
jgi:GNAT superfamily N-acetyltransferase